MTLVMFRSVNCHAPEASATFVETFCQATDGIRLGVVWIMFVEFEPPMKYRVTVPFVLRKMLVITAGGYGITRLNIVPTPPGPPLNVVPNKEFPIGKTPATGSAPSALVLVTGSIAVNE